MFNETIFPFRTLTTPNTPAPESADLLLLLQHNPVGSISSPTGPLQNTFSNAPLAGQIHSPRKPHPLPNTSSGHPPRKASLPTATSNNTANMTAPAPHVQPASSQHLHNTISALPTSPPHLQMTLLPGLTASSQLQHVVTPLLGNPLHITNNQFQALSPIWILQSLFKSLDQIPNKSLETSQFMLLLLLLTMMSPLVQMLELPLLRLPSLRLVLSHLLLQSMPLCIQW